MLEDNQSIDAESEWRDLEHLVNPRVKNIQISGIRQFFNRVLQYPDAISLTIGQPDFPTPGHVCDAGITAIREGKTRYTMNAGLPELRKAACDFLAARYGLSYTSEEAIVTVGASEGIDITLRTLLEPGSEVILPAPVYPGYAPLIELCGATPVFVDTRDTAFKLTPDALRGHLSERTRAVILPYPSNPTGCRLTQPELAALADVLRDHEVFIISDEIYSELVYDGKHHSIAAEPGMREKTIVINGLSKSHSMTGWRIGFVFAPAWLSAHILKVHQYNVSCTSSVSQYAAVDALTNGADDAAPMRSAYVERRDYALARLTSMGLPIVKPDGAFYLFPSITNTGLSSFDFASRLLDEGGVAVVPGDAFSHCGEGHIRISYACDMAKLREGLDRMERFLQGMR